jgi:hypothetical protein
LSFILIFLLEGVIMYSKAILAILGVLFQVSISNASTDRVCYVNDISKSWIYTPSADSRTLSIQTQSGSIDLGVTSYKVNSVRGPLESEKTVVNMIINNFNTNVAIKGMKIVSAQVYYIQSTSTAYMGERPTIGIYRIAKPGKSATIVVNSFNKTDYIYSSGYCARR